MTVRRVTRADDPALPTLARIYESSIPASERKPTSWLAEAAGRADFAVLAAEADGEAVGFATVFVPDDSAALLEYLAVDPDHRGGGIGSALFAAAAALAGSLPMLIEVEPAVDDCTRRRIEFYLQRGCRLIEGLRYVLPLHTTPPPPEMRLLVKWAASPSADQLQGWLDVIYQRVYQQPADDPRVGRMMRGIGGDGGG